MLFDNLITLTVSFMLYMRTPPIAMVLLIKIMVLKLMKSLMTICCIQVLNDIFSSLNFFFNLWCCNFETSACTLIAVTSIV